MEQVNSAARDALLHGSDWTVGLGIPGSDRGVRYGMSVFETIAVFRRRALLMAEHLELLESGARAAALVLPGGWRGALEAFLTDLPIVNGVVRVMLTAGDGGPFDPVVQGRLFVQWDAQEIPVEATRGPWRLAVQMGWSLATPVVKSGNYWPHIQGMKAARQAGNDEALRVDGAGLVLGGMMANVFFEWDGRLVTPSLRPGVRRGAVRNWICSQFEVEESDCPLGVVRALPMFLTNSRIGIQPAILADPTEAIAIQSAADRIWQAYRHEVLGCVDE